MKSALNMLSTKVVSANAARPSGPGSASGVGTNVMRWSVPAVGSPRSEVKRRSDNVEASMRVPPLPRWGPSPGERPRSDYVVAAMVSLQTPPDVRGVTHEWIDAAGLRPHVALAGPEDAPPMLLVHGWPQNWWAWRHLIPSLATT